MQQRWHQLVSKLTELPEVLFSAERFLAILNPIRFFVYGSPTGAVKEALAGFSPVYMEPAAGFTR